MQIMAYLNAFFGIEIASVIRRTSGGTGKKDDSANASKKSAGTAYGVSAQCKTQSYSFLINFNFLFPPVYRLIYKHVIHISFSIILNRQKGQKKGGVKRSAFFVRPSGQLVGGFNRRRCNQIKIQIDYKSPDVVDAYIL
jgi:hypothetical protein